MTRWIFGRDPPQPYQPSASQSNSLCQLRKERSRSLGVRLTIVMSNSYPHTRLVYRSQDSDILRHPYRHPDVTDTTGEKCAGEKAGQTLRRFSRNPLENSGANIKRSRKCLRVLKIVLSRGCRPIFLRRVLTCTEPLADKGSWAILDSD